MRGLRAGALALVVALAACSSSPPAADPVLRLGGIYIGERAPAVRQIFGTGSRARRTDSSGIARDVDVYRSGPAVLAIGVAGGRIASFVAYERIRDADLAREFASSRPLVAHRIAASIAALPWLGEPVFAAMLPATPDGWRVPTDFTIAAGDRQYLITRAGHVASKALSPNYGWVVDVR